MSPFVPLNVWTLAAAALPVMISDEWFSEPMPALAPPSVTVPIPYLTSDAADAPLLAMTPLYPRLRPAAVENVPAPPPALPIAMPRAAPIVNELPVRSVALLITSAPAPVAAPRPVSVELIRTPALIDSGPVNV